MVLIEAMDVVWHYKISSSVTKHAELWKQPTKTLGVKEWVGWQKSVAPAPGTRLELETHSVTQITREGV